MDKYLIPRLGLALVIFVPAMLIGIVALWGPYTHANLWNEAKPSYTRTDVARVGGEMPFVNPHPGGLRGDGFLTDPGRLVYLSAGCASCHGLDARGGVVGPSIAGASLELVRFFVRGGLGGMPAYSEASLSQAELEGLAAYLQGLEATQPSAEVSPPATPSPTEVGSSQAAAETPTPGPSAEASTPQAVPETPTPNQAALGQQYFSSRACAMCHGPKGEGSSLAPRIAGLSPQVIQGTVRSGMGPMRAFPQDILPEAELAAIIAYLQSLAQ